jgi:hypothetical protein
MMNCQILVRVVGGLVLLGSCKDRDAGGDGGTCRPLGVLCTSCPNGYLTGPGGCPTCECAPDYAGAAMDAAAPSACGPAGNACDAGAQRCGYCDKSGGAWSCACTGGVWTCAASEMPCGPSCGDRSCPANEICVGKQMGACTALPDAGVCPAGTGWSGTCCRTLTYSCAAGPACVGDNSACCSLCGTCNGCHAAGSMVECSFCGS